MFLALIGNAELLLLALTVVLVCGGAIGWVAWDCARLRRWTGGPEGPVPNFSTIHDSFGRFCRWQRATTRSGRQRSLHEISADLAAGGCVAERTGRPHQAAQNLAAVGRARLAGNLLRPTQIATCPVVPLTGPLSLLDFGVVPEVEPFQTTTRTNHLEVGWVAIVSRCDVVGDVRDLSAEGVVEGLSRPSLALGTL